MWRSSYFSLMPKKSSPSFLSDDSLILTVAETKEMVVDHKPYTIPNLTQGGGGGMLQIHGQHGGCVQEGTEQTEPFEDANVLYVQSTVWAAVSKQVTQTHTHTHTHTQT